MTEIHPPAPLTIQRSDERTGGFRKFLWENGLTLTLLGLFVFSWIGQILTGVRDYNADQQEHNQPTVGLTNYLATGHFWEVTGENWESEFLQMSMFVLLTVWLRQKGSPESKELEGEAEVDKDPREKKDDPRAPWPVRKGGVTLWLYSHSLSITFLLLFLFSFLMHAAGGAKEYSSEQMEHGQEGETMLKYMATSRFWFESFQNWQSEFLSLAAMVWLAVYLREHGSAESKPVATPHDENGD
jgi:hypothetical protein